MTPWVGLSLMLEDDFRLATSPLFAAEEVDVLEWSFDTGWNRPMPEWAEGLLDLYADAGRLLGHGVHYSAWSATWEPRQERWLESLRRELARRRYVQVSEHYGFMTAPPFSRGAPLPPPRSEAALAIGRDRLQRLEGVLDCPLGIENLALAWSRDEALAHGVWLDAFATGDSFLVLDVHNLHCQIVNFGLDVDAVLDGFALDRVREVHVSGGSDLPIWPDGPARIRCDTHDDHVPDPVFALLERALARCPNVRAVIYERLGGTIRSAEDAEVMRADYARIRRIVAERTTSARAAGSKVVSPILSDDTATLARFQSALLLALARDGGEAQLRNAFATDPALAPYRELLEAAESGPLGIAARVTKKYGRLTPPPVPGSAPPRSP